MAKRKGNYLKNTLKNLKLNEKTISQVLGILVIIIIGFLIFNSLRGQNRPAVLDGTMTQEASEQAETGKASEGQESGQTIPENLPAEYVVQKGDNLWKIAENLYRSGYNWVDIAKENNLKNPNSVLVGQKLTIPRIATRIPKVTKLAEITPKTTNPISEPVYKVQKGDYLWNIALRAYGDGYQWVKIAQANKLVNPSLIHPGNDLTIPR